MSWAINYTYVIDEMRLGNAYRAVGAISPGFGDAYNESIVDNSLQTVFDIEYAREIMQSMGFGTGFSTIDDTDWIAQAT